MWISVLVGINTIVLQYCNVISNTPTFSLTKNGKKKKQQRVFFFFSVLQKKLVILMGTNTGAQIQKIGLDAVAQS